MGISRRAVLVTGGAAVVIAGGAWAMTRDPKQARAPWREAGESFGDPRLDALACAILAPNPHNMQPWRIRLEGEDAFTVYCDPARLLPETDPPNRQITVGFGCFLELLRQAAAEKGYRADIVDFPEGEPYPLLDDRPIAQVTMAEDASVARDPLFTDMLQRRTNRAPYDISRPLDRDDLQAITAAASSGVSAYHTAEPDLVDELRTLSIDAWRAEWSAPGPRRESIAVMRIGKAENNAAPYGLSLTGPALEALAGLGLMTRKSLDDPSSLAFQQSLDMYEKGCATAMAHIWINTSSNRRVDQLNVGRAWMRMHLAANARGIALQPLSQALQEFPEMAPHYQRAHDLLAASDGETVQMLGRLGYPTQHMPPAPREPLTAHLITA